MVLNKKVKRTIWENKSKYIGAIILVILSCAVYVSFNLCGPSIKTGVERFRKDTNLEDANFNVNKRISDIEAIESKFNVMLEQMKSYEYKYGESATLRIFKESSKINKYEIKKGTRINSENDIVLNDMFAEKNNLKIGNYIDVDGKKLKVSGFMTLPDYLNILRTEKDLMTDYAKFGIAVVSEKAFENFQDANIYYSVKFKEKNKEDFKKYLNENNLITNWTDKEDNIRISGFNGDIMGFIKMGAIFPVIIIVVTCMLIAVVIWRTLKSEFTLIGTFYALGYRKGEILRHYMVYSMFISIIGGIIGTIVGLLMVKPLEITQSIQYNIPVISYQYDIDKILISLLLPFLFLMPITILVVIRALKLSPLDLIRGGGDKAKVSFIEKKLKLNIFKFNTKFKVRELLRNIPRALLMIFGVAFASMLMLSGFVMSDSIDGMVEQGFSDVNKYNHMYIFNDIKSESVKSGEKICLFPFTDVNEKNSFSLFGIQKDTKMINLKDLKGDKIGADNVIITQSLANKLKIKENDNIRVKNKLTSDKMELKIDKITEASFGNYIYMPIDEFAKINKIPNGSYNGMLTMEKLGFKSDEIASAMNKADFINGYREMVKPMKTMIIILAVVSAVIGIIIVYIVTSMVIEENKNNISLLKILGYNKKTIYKLILNSNTILVILGYILAVPITLKMQEVIFATITEQMSITISIDIKYSSLVISFVGIMIVYEVAKLMVRKKILNVSMADALKNRIE